MKRNFKKYFGVADMLASRVENQCNFMFLKEEEEQQEEEERKKV